MEYTVIQGASIKEFEDAVRKMIGEVTKWSLQRRMIRTGLVFRHILGSRGMEENQLLVGVTV